MFVGTQLQLFLVKFTLLVGIGEEQRQFRQWMVGMLKLSGVENQRQSLSNEMMDVISICTLPCQKFNSEAQFPFIIGVDA